MPLTDHIPAQEVRRRNPWLALVLSLLAVGAGQLYNGQWRKGLLFFGAEALLGGLLCLALSAPAGLAAGLAVLLGFNLYVAADAFRTARRLSAYRLAPCNRVWIYALAVAAGVGVGAAAQAVLEARFFQSYKAPSGSMIPALRVGDHFMAGILSPSDPVRRGDVVVFWEERSGKHFVKRVVGLPGETVAIEFRRVLIGGEPLAEPYVFHQLPDERMPLRDAMAPVRLGPDEYFLMGDNRERSHDSRWLGPVPRGRMRARALYVYFPGPTPEGGRFARLGAAVR
ncbi:MAG: signal peptidase I [Pseudodesulfovibrio sp.]